jgi:DnaJ-like protein
MTERKPPEMSFSTWIDQQISEAAERGAFENLPGAGKPLPKGEEDAAAAWLREYVRREGVTTEEFLPVPLKLRKESERLAEAAPALPSEQAVLEAAEELNERIMNWRRIPLGPPIFVPLVDAGELARRWREARPAGSPPEAAAGARDPGPGGSRRWRRRGRPGRRS